MGDARVDPMFRPQSPDPGGDHASVTTPGARLCRAWPYPEQGICSKKQGVPSEKQRSTPSDVRF